MQNKLYQKLSLSTTYTYNSSNIERTFIVHAHLEPTFVL